MTNPGLILLCTTLISAVEPVDFTQDVRPILASNCFLCHGPDPSSRKAGLRLDRQDDAMLVVSPGDPDGSELLHRISAHGVDRMPPEEREPLTAAEIDVLRRWIEQGAQWDEHWSWKPIQNPPLPVAHNANWSNQPIDRFILTAMERRGLTPAEDADRATLLRRVHFDLVGLPPTPETVDRFLEDDRADAYERVVDELLESPRFGEHWGQYWLDLVRYAETCGHEFDYPIPHAWRYRDWVIQAINDDVPYDRFVLEQLAGDLVEQPRYNADTGANDSIAGTGMWYLSQGTHAPVDVREDQALRIENQIDVLGTAMLGLSVRCARCHDHKFDAITTEDYYALSGHLRSTRRQNAYLDPDDAVSEAIRSRSQWNEEQLSAIETETVPMHDGKSEKGFAEFDAKHYDGWFESGWAFGGSPTPIGALILEGSHPRVTTADCAHSGSIALECQGTLRSPTFAIQDDAIHIRARGHGGRMRLIIDGFVLGEYNGLLFETHIVDVDSADWTNYTMNTSRYRGHLAHLAFIDDGDGFLAVDAVRFGALDDTTWNIDVDDELAVRNAALAAIALNGTPPVVPAPIRVLAAEDGTRVDEHVFIRGRHDQPGPVMPRRFIASLGGEPPLEMAEGSGRLELAERLLNESNPFPARVMANRIWYHLMGRGLVATPDEFGALGSPPSHPELLDHLAVRFRSNWSVKSLVRDIVRSRTYRMSSALPDEAMLEIDPDNILLHRAPRKRMNAQMLRDTVLAVSGRLDTTAGGPSVPVHLTSFMTGRGRPGTSGPRDGDGRRTIYQEVRRNFLPPMLRAWDRPAACRPIGRRSVSNVPAQGLALLNDPFIAEQADVWANRILAETGRSDREHIQRMYLEAFGRSPSEAETAQALGFIQTGGDTAWTDLGHVLFNSKEFVFID